MPYVVTPEQGTPLWADHQMTLKKGTVKKGTEFVANQFNEEYQVLKVDGVSYIPKKAPAGTVIVPGVTEIWGDGWIEYKNVMKIETTNPPDEPPVQLPPFQLPLPGFEDGTYMVTIRKVS